MNWHTVEEERVTRQETNIEIVLLKNYTNNTAAAQCVGNMIHLALFSNLMHFLNFLDFTLSSVKQLSSTCFIL